MSDNRGFVPDVWRSALWEAVVQAVGSPLKFVDLLRLDTSFVWSSGWRGGVEDGGGGENKEEKRRRMRRSRLLDRLNQTAQR